MIADLPCFSYGARRDPDSPAIRFEAGRPVARLVALARPTKPREIGLLKGKLTVPEDFDVPQSAEELREFSIDP